MGHKRSWGETPERPPPPPPPRDREVSDTPPPAPEYRVYGIPEEKKSDTELASQFIQENTTIPKSQLSGDSPREQYDDDICFKWLDFSGEHGTHFHSDDNKRSWDQPAYERRVWNYIGIEHQGRIEIIKVDDVVHISMPSSNPSWVGPNNVYLYVKSGKSMEFQFDRKERAIEVACELMQLVFADSTISIIDGKEFKSG